jgi:hypothetical protein
MKKVTWALPFLVVACSSDPDATGTTGGTDAGALTAQCTSAAEQLLKPVDSVSTGAVTVLEDAAGAKTLFVDASAGGTQGAATNPRIYLNLETAVRVDVTDKTAFASTAWDVAIKRPILFTNSGDGGSGRGGSKMVEKEFDAVTTADAAAETFAQESFFDANCTAKVDQTGAVKTSFDGWYNYDQATNGVSPKAATWIIRGGTGKLYKLRVLSYYANPDGTTGQAGGRYTIKVAAL